MKKTFAILGVGFVAGFDSFTLNIPDSIPAPTAKAEIEINVNTANTLETVILFLKITTEASSKKAPNHTSQAL